jgi:hypothetical protein
MKRSGHEIARAYDIQRKAIAASCASYDAGNKWEALRLATAIYTMVHDHGRIQSVLSQAGVKHNLLWIATGLRVDEPVISKFYGSTCLVALLKNDDGTSELAPLCTYIDKLDIPMFGRFLPFEEWWEKDIISFEREYREPRILLDLYTPDAVPKEVNFDVIQAAVDKVRALPEDRRAKDGFLTKMTRRQLVFALRNQEGGGHFDPEGVPNRNYTALLKPLLMLTYPNLNICGDRELATMRQVAEELRITLLANGAKNKGDLPIVTQFALALAAMAEVREPRSRSGEYLAPSRLGCFGRVY